MKHHLPYQRFTVPVNLVESPSLENMNQSLLKDTTHFILLCISVTETKAFFYIIAGISKEKNSLIHEAIKNLAIMDAWRGAK